MDIQTHSFVLRISAVLVGLCALTLTVGGFVRAVEIKINNPELAPLAVQTPEPRFLEAIAKAKKMLAATPPLINQKGRIDGVIVDRKQIALAVFNLETNEIAEHRFWLDNKQLSAFDEKGVITPLPVTATDNIPLQIRRWNGFNSFFSFTDHPELIVIANKYAVANNTLGSLALKAPVRRGQPKQTMTDIIYVPYSEALRTQEIVQQGKKHLDEIVNKAVRELEAAKVMSQSFPGIPVTKAYSRELIKNVLVIEHVDPGEFALATDNGRALAERALTIVGANDYIAYRYTGSPAGANGMAQFIKSTYDYMVRTYPRARLIHDYRLGMADHVNAVKAMYLFFDTHQKDLEKQIKNQTVANALHTDENILVASYNAGTRRVATSINTFGLNWFTGQLVSNEPILREETLTYVQKFQAIRALRIL